MSCYLTRSVEPFVPLALKKQLLCKFEFDKYINCDLVFIKAKAFIVRLSLLFKFFLVRTSFVSFIIPVNYS